MILQYFKKKENIEKKRAKEIYNKVLLESNLLLNKYSLFKVKNYESSFEIVSILLIIYIKLNIRLDKKNFKKINEELISFFIADLDDSLRSKGIGDMSIGKYVKKYVKRFYFRLSKFPYDYEQININNINNYLNNFDLIKDDYRDEASKIFYETFKKILNSH